MAIALLSTSQTARAQDRIDVNPFHPAPGTGRLLILDLAEAPPSFQFSAQAITHYADEPLQLTRGGTAIGGVVAHRLTTDFAIAFAFLHRWQLSLALPVTWYQEGSPASRDFGFAPTRSRAAEDLRLAGKVRLAGSDCYGVGASLELVFPTGAADQYLGSRNVTGSGRLFAHAGAGWFRATAMVGWRFAFEEERFFSARSGNSLLAGVGLGARVWSNEARSRSVELTAEAWGQFHPPFDQPVNLPAEVLASAQYRVGEAWTFYFGAGTGLDRGAGESHIRLVAGLSGAWDWVLPERPSAPQSITSPEAAAESPPATDPAHALKPSPEPQPESPDPSPPSLLRESPALAARTRAHAATRSKAPPARQHWEDEPSKSFLTRNAIPPPSLPPVTVEPASPPPLKPIDAEARGQDLAYRRAGEPYGPSTPGLTSDELARELEDNLDQGRADVVAAAVSALADRHASPAERQALALRLTKKLSRPDPWGRSRRFEAFAHAELPRLLLNTLVYLLRTGGHPDEAKRIEKHLRVALPELPIRGWHLRSDLFDELGAANYQQLADVETRHHEGLWIQQLLSHDGRWHDYVFFIHSGKIDHWLPLAEIRRGAYVTHRDPPPETWILDARDPAFVERGVLYAGKKDEILGQIARGELKLDAAFVSDYGDAAKELNNDVMFYITRGARLQDAIASTRKVHVDEEVQLVVALSSALGVAAANYHPEATDVAQRRLRLKGRSPYRRVGEGGGGAGQEEVARGLSSSEVERIRALPRGHRPENPSDYLSKAFIEEHLQQFQGGVVKITRSAPTGSCGPPGERTFVMPRSVANDLEARAGGDPRKLEQLLGLNRGELGDHPMRVDIPSPTGLGMPNGNERGANGQWMPGGYTSGGMPEASIDSAPAGTYIVRPIVRRR